ncbi:MAG: DUF3422 family protein [Opitutaceae bacterium]|nr:DUF3422 family protein [Opitutaceae bacterium]
MLESQNRDLLNSMNRCAKTQLRLQETVEALSIAAISYYIVGLVHYIAKALTAYGINTDLLLSNKFWSGARGFEPPTTSIPILVYFDSSYLILRHIVICCLTVYCNHSLY